MKVLYWPGGLADVSVPHIICENTLSLVLQHLHTPHLTQTTGLWLEEDNGLHAATLCWIWRKISEPRRGGAWCLQTIFHDHTHRDMISNTALTSVSRAGDSEAALVVRSWDMSQATDHWHRCSRNKSFQHSWSNNIWTMIFTHSNKMFKGICLEKQDWLTWSEEERVWKGARHLAHLTAMKRSLAAVSWRVSQVVGRDGSWEWSRGGDMRGGGRDSGWGGWVSGDLILQRFLFLSTVLRKEWNDGCWPNTGDDNDDVSDDSGEWPGDENDLLNIAPAPDDPNRPWPAPGNSGLECGKVKLVGVKNPSLVTLGFLGPLSCCTASLFMELSKHFLSLQARHWLRWVLSMGHLPFSSDDALQV